MLSMPSLSFIASASVRLGKGGKFLNLINSTIPKANNYSVLYPSSREDGCYR